MYCFHCFFNKKAYLISPIFKRLIFCSLVSSIFCSRMQNRPYHHIALWGFLIGILFIVFIQFLSGRNINHLTQLNTSLLSELRLQNDLQAALKFDIFFCGGAQVKVGSCVAAEGCENWLEARRAKVERFFSGGLMARLIVKARVVWVETVAP